MDWRVLNLRLKEFFSAARTQVSIPCSSRAMEFGLALLWFSSRSIYSISAIGFLDSLQFLPIYDILVPFSGFLLGFTVWGLCGNLWDTEKVQANAGTGSCFICTSKNQSCNGFSRGVMKRGSRDQEEEGDDVVKFREGNVKRRKHQMVKDSDNDFRSHGVCCNACDPKIQYCKEFQCERCRGKRACSQRTRNCIGGKEDEEDEEGEEKEEGGFDEDEEDVTVKLRKELVKERKLRAWTEMELEKERRAASSAAYETMSKILLLQNEKGLTEREARQYREMAEQKHAYDQEVIENLKWIILNLQEGKICNGETNFKWAG